MGRTDKSHGMGNNGGYGQPGMLGNLLTVGKGTMNGIGMLSSLMGMGKFFFSGLEREDMSIAQTCPSVY